MAKQNELDILRAAADKLGADSYCGPWLSQQIAFVESAIRSDFFPDVDLNKTRAACADEARRCADLCADKIAMTEKQCVAMTARAEKEAREVRDSVASAVHQALRAIQSW